MGKHKNKEQYRGREFSRWPKTLNTSNNSVQTELLGQEYIQTVSVRASNEAGNVLATVGHTALSIRLADRYIITKLSLIYI